MTEQTTTSLLTKEQWAKLDAYMVEKANSIPGFRFTPGFYLNTPGTIDDGYVGEPEDPDEDPGFICAGCALGLLAVCYVLDQNPDYSLTDAYDELTSGRQYIDPYTVKHTAAEQILAIVNENTDHDTAYQAGLDIESGFEARYGYEELDEDVAEDTDEAAFTLGHRLRDIADPFTWE